MNQPANKFALQADEQGKRADGPRRLGEMFNLPEIDEEPEADPAIPKPQPKLDDYPSEEVTCETHGCPARRYEMPIGPALLVCPECRAERERLREAATRRDEESEERARANRRLAEEQRRQIRIARYRTLSNLPTRHATSRFSDFHAALPGQERALRWCQGYATGFDRMLEQGTGLILSGKTGTGKTMLACCIANHLLEEARPVLYHTAATAVRLIRASWGRNADVTEDQQLDRLISPALLILDEIGVAHGSDSERTLLTQVIDSRYQHQLPTLLISNFDENGLINELGLRIISRMREGGGRILPFNWDDQRN